LHAGWAYLVVRDARRGGGGGTGVLLALSRSLPVSLKRRSPRAHARASSLRAGAPLPYAPYRSYPTEFMGCMIGEIHGNAVIVRRIAPGTWSPALHRHPRRAGTDL